MNSYKLNFLTEQVIDDVILAKKHGYTYVVLTSSFDKSVPKMNAISLETKFNLSIQELDELAENVNSWLPLKRLDTKNGMMVVLATTQQKQ